MTKIRLQFWILKLQQLANKVIHRCYSCKKFGTLFRWRTTRDLPKDRAEGYIPFQEVEADFAGPIAYKIKGKKEGKAYIILFYNRLSRALYLQILKDQKLMDFLKSLKRFLARRGYTEKIYSGNASTIVVLQNGFEGYLKMKDCMTFLPQLQFHGSLILAEYHGGELNLN